MSRVNLGAEFFGKEKIGKIILKIAPPVMLAQLIQALYNVVDSLFIGRYSGDGLTALSVIYPFQLILIALAVGTGVGVNTLMAKHYAMGRRGDADKTAGTGLFLELVTWAVFAVASIFVLEPYARLQASSEQAVTYCVEYGRIISVGSIGLFLESNWTKVHQAQGNMKTPMIAQIVGAAVNIVLDPVLIFGFGFVPEMGVKGAAIATVIGQCAAAVIVGVKAFRKIPSLKEARKYIKEIYRLGYPSILMQSLFTVYIFLLNTILGGFCDDAVTVLGLYYKAQSFFFIPLFGLQTCIVPVLSYNFNAGDIERCKKIFKTSLVISAAFMAVGIFAFEVLPVQVLKLFGAGDGVVAIGENAFRLIGLGFLPSVFSMMTPVYFQAIGASKTSTFLSVLRQLICLVPIFWAFSLIGLDYCWLSFPISETITGSVGMILYYRELKHFHKSEAVFAAEPEINDDSPRD